MQKLLFICLLCLLFKAQAQSPADSLSLIAKNEAALKGYLSSPDSSIVAAENTLALAKKFKFRYIEGESYYILSKAHWTKSNNRLSVEYGFKALQIFKGLNDSSYWNQSILSIARNCIDMNDLVRADRLIASSFSFSLNNKNKRLLADAYREYALLLMLRKQYDSALLISDKAISFYETVHDARNTGILYGRKSKIYYLMKEYSNSFRYTLKSLQMDRRAGNNRALCIDYYQSAEDHFRLAEYDSAMIQLNRSDSLAIYIGNLQWRIRSHQMMEDILEKKNLKENALAEFKIIVSLKDMVQKREAARQVEEANALNELESKEREINLLEKENEIGRQLVKTRTWISYYLTAVILLMAIVVGLLYRFRQAQTKTNRILSSKNAAIELQRAEIQLQAEDLRALNLQKSKLFSVISHDLRGPVANLQRLLAMVSQRMLTQEEFLEISGRLKGDLNVNQRTLENLLAWALSQMDGIKIERKKIYLAEMIGDVSHLMNEVASEKRITLEHQVGEFSVLADAAQVQLILRNIIHNAIKFSVNDSKIMILAKAEDKYCFISVRDFGVGLTPEEIEILSNTNDHYTRAGTKQEKGTGLGWLICKEFIARNGGRFFIKSAPGEGTEITFTLPLA